MEQTGADGGSRDCSPARMDHLARAHAHLLRKAANRPFNTLGIPRIQSLERIGEALKRLGRCLRRTELPPLGDSSTG